MSPRTTLRATVIIVLTLAGAATMVGSAPAQAQPNLCDLPVVGTVCTVGQFAVDPEGAATSMAASGFKGIVDSMLGGFGRMLEWSLAWWIKLPSTDLTQMSALATVREYTTGLQVLLMTGTVMLTAGRLAMAHRGALAGEVQESFTTFARAVFASWMFAAVITMATRSGDAFSEWVISDVTHDDATGTLSRMADFSHLVGKESIGLAGMFILGLIGFVGALLQLVLLVIRQALLIVVVAVIPIAAAAAGSGPGSQAYKRLVSWSIAFALFKPVGAIVYVVAFEAAGSPSADGQERLLGLILLALVALVLPALMRMVAPVVSTMGSGGGGVAAAAMLGGGVGMAAGAAAKAGANASGDAQSAGDDGGSPGSGGTGPSSGGRAMTPGSSGADGGSPPPGTGGGAAGARTSQAAQGANSAGAGAGGASAASGAGAAAAGPAALAVGAAQAAHTTAQHVGERVGSEADAGTENGSGAMGQHEVRR
ncbi:hypothetical protein [Nocardia arthritidis]|uniref:Type IV secretion system protein n=1 Tax=Nocardia arthritidis TaxID=228602 RepID=A0A6G9Y6U0_9NOCA|nr:hypothetical protein [Nocardia arthritidis]QIS08797.1 hypothetical protein F5544_04415 [Nocardia arthritidis]